MNEQQRKEFQNALMDLINTKAIQTLIEEGPEARDFDTFFAAIRSEEAGELVSKAISRAYLRKALVWEQPTSQEVIAVGEELVVAEDNEFAWESLWGVYLKNELPKNLTECRWKNIKRGIPRTPVPKEHSGRWFRLSDVQHL